MIQKQTKSLKDRMRLSVYTVVVYRSNFNSDEDYNSYINENYEVWEKIKEVSNSEGPVYSILMREDYI